MGAGVVIPRTAGGAPVPLPGAAPAGAGAPPHPSRPADRWVAPGPAEPAGPPLPPGEHFAAALGAFVLGGLGLVWVAPDLGVGAFLAVRVIGVVHLFTLG